MREPVIDVIIPVHTSIRPIERAVRSIVEGTLADTRVLVVAHNIDPEVIRRRLGAWAEHPSVDLLHLDDGVASPSGPFNLGLDQVAAPWFALMGSDDELEPGALNAWLSTAEDFGAHAVIPRVQQAGGSAEATPPTRRRTPARGLVDPVRDRLAYRSAPLGLLSHESFGHLRFTEGLSSGEDLGFVMQVWFSGHAIAHDRSAPAYLVHADGTDRVSFEPRSVDADFAFLHDTIDTAWFARLAAPARRLIVIKLLRMQVLDAVVNRFGTVVSDDDRAALSSAVNRLIEASPGAVRFLSAVDAGVIDDLRRGRWRADRWKDLIGRRWNLRDLGAAVPRNLLLSLHRDGPARTMLAHARAAQFVVKDSAA